MKDALGEELEVGDLIVEIWKGQSLFYSVIGFTPKQVKAVVLLTSAVIMNPIGKNARVYSKSVVKVDLEKFTQAYLHAGGAEENVTVFIEHVSNTFK